MNKPGPANCKLMIVDDMPENLQVLGKMLMDNGFNTSFALSGKEALEGISKNKPDLLLLDLNMPEMDGFEVLIRLKNNEETNDIPVIFLTASNSIDDIVEAFNHGAVDYVTKPFNQIELLSRINVQFELSESRRIIKIQNQKLEAHNRNKDQLISIIGHDMRNVFCNQVNYSKILNERIDDFAPDKRDKFLSLLYSNAVHGSELLENLVEWAKAQSNKVGIKPAVIAVGKIIERCMLLLDGEAFKKDVKFNSDIDAKCTAFVDPVMLETVLRNLLSNAIKFSHKNSLIGISARTQGDRAIIEVSDSGVGMTDQQIKNIMLQNEFNSTKGTNNETGTGLGLMLCSNLIAMNKGIMNISSTQGAGTTFTVSFSSAEFHY